MAARAAVRWNGIDAVALTKLDVLDEIEEIPIATGYRIGGEVVTEVPDDVADLAEADPIYEVMPGWCSSTSGVTVDNDLPDAARRYVARLEELLDVPVAMISTGPRREETILRAVPPFSKWFPELFHRKAPRSRSNADAPPRS